MQPEIERRIEDIVNNPEREEVTFVFDLNTQDYLAFNVWQDYLHAKYPFPSCFSYASAPGSLYENGDRTLRHIELRYVDNDARLKTAERVPIYTLKPVEKDLYSMPIVYDLVSRIGFKESDFEKGKTGRQGSILVRGIELKCKKSKSCLAEMDRLVRKLSRQAVETYVLIVFNLPKNLTLNDIDLHSVKLQNTHTGNAFWPAEILDYKNNRYYLLFRNTHRHVLDMHGIPERNVFGITKRHGLALVKSFIREQYDLFKPRCTIRTGNGKGHPVNGVEGGLRLEFPDWMKDPRIAPLITGYELTEDGGNYTVTLVPPQECNLIGLDDEVAILRGASCIFMASATKEHRIRFLTKDRNFTHKLLGFLGRSGIGPVGVPLRFSFDEGEVRVTLTYRDDPSPRNLLARSQEPDNNGDDSDERSWYLKNWRDPGRIVGSLITEFIKLEESSNESDSTESSDVSPADEEQLPTEVEGVKPPREPDPGPKPPQNQGNKKGKNPKKAPKKAKQPKKSTRAVAPKKNDGTKK